MFKIDCQKYLAKLQKMKNTQSTIKTGKQPGARFCLGYKDYTQNFRPQEVEITNKVLRKKSHYQISRGF